LPAEARAPLAVYVVWHPECELAETLATQVFKDLCANPEFPARRGLGLPVRFRTSTTAADVPSDVPFGAAAHTAVFIVADVHLVASGAWRAYVERVVGAAGEADLVVPAALTQVANLPPSLAELMAIRLADVPDPSKAVVFLRDVMHCVCRLLAPAAGKVKVFLSHAKGDGLGITTTVLRYLNEEARLDHFFDAADIPDGSRFAEYLVSAVGSSPSLLAIQTDTYSSREWCRLEVLEGKRQRIPIVVLSAIEGGEARAFPYMGNVPVVRWKGEDSLSEIALGVLREVLRARYFPLRVRSLASVHGIDLGDQVFAYPPELLTALLLREDGEEHASRRYLYPDPPLGTEELRLIHSLDPAIDPVTPTILAAT
jgi:TIR domain-containing protein